IDESLGKQRVFTGQVMLPIILRVVTRTRPRWVTGKVIYGVPHRPPMVRMVGIRDFAGTLGCCAFVVLGHGQLPPNLHGVYDGPAETPNRGRARPGTENPIADLGSAADAWLADYEGAHAPKRVGRGPAVMPHAVREQRSHRSASGSPRIRARQLVARESKSFHAGPPLVGDRSYNPRSPITVSPKVVRDRFDALFDVATPRIDLVVELRVGLPSI